MLLTRREALAGCCGGLAWLTAAVVANSGAELDEHA